MESSPTGSPNTGYLFDMIVTHGVGNYCDTIGVHAYGSQFSEDVIKLPWVWQEQAGSKKPVGISECGVPLNAWWTATEITDVQWRERWHALAYVQAKSFGYSYMILFTHTGETEWTDKSSYRDRNNNFQPIQPNYGQAKSILKRRSFGNGNFENANDTYKEWVSMIPFDQPIPPNDTIFVQGDSDGAFEGNGYLKLTRDGREQRRAKRIVPNLTIGATYQITAKMNMVDSGGIGNLAARGYDPNNGDSEVQDEKRDLKPGWNDMKVNFVAKNSWVVIELRADYGVEMRWDNVKISQLTGKTN